MTLRALIVTQDDPFYMPLFFEEFFDSLPEDVTVTDVTILQSFDESTLDLAQRMYRLYGLRNFLQRGMQFSYRKLANALGAAYSVPAVAAQYDVPVTHRQSVNTDSFVEQVERDDIDVILSVSAPEIFDARTLSSPNWGCLNVHTSALPKYRGMLPTFWALYHGDEEIGVTVHTMAEAIDHGKIVRQTTFPVSERSLDTVIKRGKRTGGALAADVLSEIGADEVTLAEMDGEASYFSFPTASDRREFQRRGGELL